MLKIIKEWPYQEMSVADAIEDAIDGSARQRDDLETVQASARLTGEVLGRLVEVLAKTGSLSAPDVQHILGYPYKVVD
jgi:hypothetical protein